MTAHPVDCSVEYLGSEAAKETWWYGKGDLFAFDPPWGVLKNKTGPGQPDELLVIPKVKKLAKWCHDAGGTNAVCLIRLTLEMYMDWKRAFVEAGWIVQLVPKISYKGAKFMQHRNTKKGHLSGQL